MAHLVKGVVRTTIGMCVLTVLFGSDASAQSSANYIPPPDDLASFMRMADGVAVVEVTNGVTRSFVHPLTTPPVQQTVTEYTVRILDVVKSADVEPLVVGATLPVLKSGARPEDSPGRSDKGFPGLNENKEYVLFLRWDPAIHEYWIARGPHGRYELASGVNRSGPSSTSLSSRLPSLTSLVTNARHGSTCTRTRTSDSAGAVARRWNQSTTVSPMAMRKRIAFRSGCSLFPLLNPEPRPI